MNGTRLLPIQNKILVANYQNCATKLENMLRDSKGLECTDWYERTSALLNNVYQKIDELKAMA